MNIVELARKAGLVGDSTSYDLADELKYLETFRRLCIEDFVKSSVDVEPVGELKADEFEGHTFIPAADRWPFGEPLYTAEQVAAKVHKALEQAAQVCDERYDNGGDYGFKKAADAIRALKEKV